jgi:hypothetical protein
MNFLKKILFSLLILVLVGSIIESFLYILTDNNRNKNIQIIRDFDQKAWIHYRDQFLPNAFEKKQSTWTTHPTYEKRGLPYIKIRNPKKGLRLLALGGSTTVGIPFEKEIGGFPKRLEAMLKKQKQQQNVQVINAAIPGMASGSFSQITKQLRDLEIDGVLIYAGNNEHPATMYSYCLGEQEESSTIGSFLHQSRIYRFLRQKLTNQVEIHIQEAIQKQEDCLHNVALQVHKTQPNDTNRTDYLRQVAKNNFKKNLTEIVTAHSRTPFFIAIPPINYQSPPKLSLPNQSKTTEEKTLLQKDLIELQDLWEKRLYGKIRRKSEQLNVLHPEYALINYHLGMSAIRVGKEDIGKKHLELALEQDWQLERITPDLQLTLHEICSTHSNAICVDVDNKYKEIASIPSLPGNDLFVDYCHPTKKRGTDAIASEFLRVILQHQFGIKYNPQPHNNND